MEPKTITGRWIADGAGYIVLSNNTFFILEGNGNWRTEKCSTDTNSLFSAHEYNFWWEKCVNEGTFVLGRKWERIDDNPTYFMPMAC